MGISIREFEVAMETFGAKRLPDRYGSRYKILVPCFQLDGIQFFHSGSYYIVHSGYEIPCDIMNQAMAECGEEHPGGDNFWWGEVHSIRGMLILATMLRGDYSKALVDELTNEAYKKLLECSLIKNNVKFPFEFSTHSPKMQEIRELLEEYSNVINPFGNGDFKRKEPIGYLDKIKVRLSASKEECTDAYARLTLNNLSFETLFNINSKGWTYRSYVPVVKNNTNGNIYFYHYYENELNNTNVAEVVHLEYSQLEKDNETLTIKTDFNISLKTGLAWETYNEEEAAPATDEQIDVIISHLKISIEYLKENVLYNIIEKEK